MKFYCRVQAWFDVFAQKNGTAAGALVFGCSCVVNLVLWVVLEVTLPLIVGS